jgi:hypothetical protein
MFYSPQDACFFCGGMLKSSRSFCRCFSPSGWSRTARPLSFFQTFFLTFFQMFFQMFFPYFPYIPQLQGESSPVLRTCHMQPHPQEAWRRTFHKTYSILTFRASALKRNVMITTGPAGPQVRIPRAKNPAGKTEIPVPGSAMSVVLSHKIQAYLL